MPQRRAGKRSAKLTRRRRHLSRELDYRDCQINSDFSGVFGGFLRCDRSDQQSSDTVRPDMGILRCRCTVQDVLDVRFRPRPVIRQKKKTPPLGRGHSCCVGKSVKCVFAFARSRVQRGQGQTGREWRVRELGPTQC